ncbi:MAG: hypothetical protein JWN75_40 [Candidatus Saccharibacteria bacterium]|nr:hypothetical protein [Candidatus Saccharibacteria bacterium]
MSGDVTDQKTDLTNTTSGVCFRIKTDAGHNITLYPTAITGCGDEGFARGIAVVGVARIGDHRVSMVTRVITRHTDFVVRSKDIHGRQKAVSYLGNITQIIQGSC